MQFAGPQVEDFFAGLWTFQHLDSQWPYDIRKVMHAIRITQDVGASKQISKRARVLGGLFWDSIPSNTTQVAQWAQAAASVATPGGGAVLAQGQTWSSDPGIAAQEAVMPFRGFLNYPPGYPGLSISDDDQDNQTGFFVGAGGALLTPYWSGPIGFGTPVFDVTGQAIDYSRAARLQDLFRITKFPVAPGGTSPVIVGGPFPAIPALQLGDSDPRVGGSGDDSHGYGATVDDYPSQNPGDGQIIGFLGHGAGGPMFNGIYDDPHNFWGQNSDNEQAGITHLEVGTLFHTHTAMDGPLSFTNEYYPDEDVFDYDNIVNCYIVWDGNGSHSLPDAYSPGGDSDYWPQGNGQFDGVWRIISSAPYSLYLSPFQAGTTTGAPGTLTGYNTGSNTGVGGAGAGVAAPRTGAFGSNPLNLDPYATQNPTSAPLYGSVNNPATPPSTRGKAPPAGLVVQNPPPPPQPPIPPPVPPTPMTPPGDPGDPPDFNPPFINLFNSKRDKKKAPKPPPHIFGRPKKPKEGTPGLPSIFSPTHRGTGAEEPRDPSGSSTGSRFSGLYKPIQTQTVSNSNPFQSYVQIGNQTAFSSILIKPQSFVPGSTDVRQPGGGSNQAWVDDAPIIAQLTGYGNQYGAGAGGNTQVTGPFNYCNTTSSFQHFYRMATGSLAFLPAGFDLAQLIQGLTLPSPASATTQYPRYCVPTFTFYGSQVGFGIPQLVGGGITTGHTIWPDHAGNTTVTQVSAPTSAGVVTSTPIFRFTPTGAQNWNSTSSAWAPLTTGGGIYGDGSSGAFVFNGSNTYLAVASLSGSTYTLKHPLLATSISISGGITVNCVTTGNICVPIFCLGVFSGSGTIQANGLNGANAVTGTGGAGGGGVQSILGGNASAAGGAGGNAGGTGTNGGACEPGGLGGNGGSGGQGDNGTLAPGGSGSSTGLSTGAPWQTSTTLLSGMYAGDGLTGGGGGGGGGGGATSLAGGGGGGGAPFLLIAARYWQFTGTINCVGGNGGNASGSTTGGGGGAGGGGGLLAMIADSYTGSFTTSVAGGIGGNGGYASGGPGNAGQAKQLTNA